MQRRTSTAAAPSSWSWVIAAVQLPLPSIHADASAALGTSDFSDALAQIQDLMQRVPTARLAGQGRFKLPEDRMAPQAEGDDAVRPGDVRKIRRRLMHGDLGS
jgi:hypothetical protein